jgi:GntR family transcriptional repressor for pyruvate dehydrogenase complex
MPADPTGGSDAIAEALGSLPSGTPVSEVARRLLDLFTSGDIAPGTRLPAERQLATSLGVGRSAVREALAALEMLGIVDVRPGSGTYLRGEASALLPQTLRWGLLIGERNTAELIELRSGLEIYVARMAATHASAAARDTLAGHLDDMRAAGDDLQAFAKADFAFHRAVHSRVQAAVALEEHEAVARAIESNDADAAASAMAVHMVTAGERLADSAR